MASLWLTLPIIIPVLTSVVGYFLRSYVRGLSLLSGFSALLVLLITVCLLQEVLANGPQAVAFGRWIAPFGIVFVADSFSAVMVFVSAIIGMVIVIYAIADISSRPSYGLYHVLFHVLLAGVYGAFLTGDMFNLYVWFEVMLIASFGLMVLDAQRRQIDGAIKYVTLNLISTMTLLLAIGVLYGVTGTLNLADLHHKVATLPFETSALLAVLFMFAFALKSALFPLFAWLPASYHTLPSAVVALFAALLTKVGVYALFRLFTLVFPLDQSGWQEMLLWVAGLTMLTGVLGAASQYSVKRILSFHIISQIGYMVLGLALYTPLAIAGAVFYLIHHIIVKANLFLIGGVLQRRCGTDQLRQLGGAYQAMPGLAFLFIIPAFSLAGFPPLSGFWGKFLVIKAGFVTQHYLLAAVALVVGLLTVFSMTKIWSEAFWKAPPQKLQLTPLSPGTRWLYYVPMLTLTSITICIGLAAEPFYDVAEQAAEQLLNPERYLEAVLGGRP
ncbi:proton-conducting transporter membrane subunit [Vibrio sp. CAU 1672]|uniref:proton-conducting transporter transmembrane domain-containing protein n=1 Tax=Vibrio sp. CAU 1672 TaxID=3032594 RepID=UPI0023DB9996|nr:proton-conducting transporter membrane subunit [Vibrio sp. CAU 1672]MDF2153840.1 proton-conducting transporter membrane subunit [Vibrio sp. CAU 1672]